MASAFLDLLAEKVALGDGAMGTLLYERGVFPVVSARLSAAAARGR